MSGTQPPCGRGQDTGVTEGHEDTEQQFLVGLLHGGRHELLRVCCCGLEPHTRTAE